MCPVSFSREVAGPTAAIGGHPRGRNFKELVTQVLRDESTWRDCGVEWTGKGLSSRMSGGGVRGVLSGRGSVRDLGRRSGGLRVKWACGELDLIPDAVRFVNLRFISKSSDPSYLSCFSLV